MVAFSFFLFGLPQLEERFFLVSPSKVVRIVEHLKERYMGAYSKQRITNRQEAKAQIIISILQKFIEAPAQRPHHKYSLPQLCKERQKDFDCQTNRRNLKFPNDVQGCLLAIAIFAYGEYQTAISTHRANFLKNQSLGTGSLDLFSRACPLICGRGDFVLQYFLYQKLFTFLMSAEDQEVIDQYDQFPFQSLKIVNQNTTIYFKHKNTCQPCLPEFESLQTTTDCSFQQGIHQQNIENLKNATVKFLEESLTGSFNKSEGFRDVSLYDNLPFEVGGLTELQMLTFHNQLLNERDQHEFLRILKEESQLVSLLRQLTPTFGITVAKEIVFAISTLLKEKLQSFKSLVVVDNPIIPRFSCFQGFQEQQAPFHSSCPIYDQINLEELVNFAEKDLDQLSSNLYFSYQIKFLNLRQINSDTKGDIFYRFKVLMKQLSRTLFFTLAGAVDLVAPQGNPLDLSREVSFSEFSEVNGMTITRSISRPFVPCEQQPLDFLSKRLKFE